MSGADKPPTGPGATRFEVAEDGGILIHRWGDPAWGTTFIPAHEMQSPQAIAKALRRAYEVGYGDRGIAVRKALGLTA